MLSRPPFLNAGVVSSGHAAVSQRTIFFFQTYAATAYADADAEE